MNDKNSPHGAKADQSTAPHEPIRAAQTSDKDKTTTHAQKAAKARPLRLYCCLPEGETYTDQPANKKAAELEARARSWIEANPSAWSRMISEVKAAVKAERRWAMRRILEEARTYDLVDSNGEPFRVNNNIEPALARILCEEMPEAREYVELRMSVFEVAHAERER